MDTLQQIQVIVQQAVENSECIASKMDWYNEKIQSLQDEIDNIKEKFSKNTEKFRQERIAKLLEKKNEYMTKAQEYKQQAMDAASAWLDEQKEILLNKLKEMIATMLKAKTL